MESALPTLLLRRSRSEAALERTRKKAPLVIADADVDPKMSQSPLNTLDSSARKSNDNEMTDMFFAQLSHSQITPHSQQRSRRPSSTSALVQAVGRRKEDVCSSLSHSQEHWPRPLSTPSQMPKSPSKSPMRRDKFHASLNRALVQPMKIIQGQREKRSKVSMCAKRRYTENLRSKSQLGKSLNSMQIKEHPLCGSPEDVRHFRAQSILAQTSQGDEVPLDLCQMQLPHGLKTIRTIKEPTLSKYAEFKQRRGSCEVTKELNCPLDTTKDAQGLFNHYATYNGKHGYIEYQNFGEIVVQIMKSTKQKLSPEAMQKKIEVSWLEADRNYNGKLDFDEFAIWYSSWGFQQELLLSPKKIRTREFAKKYNLSILDVDSVHSKFQLFDEDGSGEIEFPEFEKLLYKLMKVPCGQELPASRLKHFWKEIDIDGSGSVCFDEFLQWYSKYFDMKGNSDVSPIEHFYQSARPNLGRSMQAA